MEKDANLEPVVDRLLNEVRHKNVLLDEIKAEIYRANRDYERLTVVGAIKNLHTTLHEVECENRALKKELERLITRK